MKPALIATRRATLLQAWRVAQKRIDADGAAQLDGNEAAGQLLAKWESANVAYAMCPGEEWWDVTRGLLAEVVRDEGGAVLPNNDPRRRA